MDNMGDLNEKIELLEWGMANKAVVNKAFTMLIKSLKIAEENGDLYKEFQKMMMKSTGTLDLMKMNKIMQNKSEEQAQGIKDMIDARFREIDQKVELYTKKIEFSLINVIQHVLENYLVIVSYLGVCHPQQEQLIQLKVQEFKQNMAQQYSSENSTQSQTEQGTPLESQMAPSKPAHIMTGE
jgi:hypothetical protein